MIKKEALIWLKILKNSFEMVSRQKTVELDHDKIWKALNFAINKLESEK